MDDALAAQRMKTTLELFDAGVEIKRENLCREDPAASDEEIEVRLRAWLSHRPGAEHGDVSGDVRLRENP